MGLPVWNLHSSSGDPGGIPGVLCCGECTLPISTFPPPPHPSLPPPPPSHITPRPSPPPSCGGLTSRFQARGPNVGYKGFSCRGLVLRIGSVTCHISMGDERAIHLPIHPRIFGTPPPDVRRILLFQKSVNTRHSFVLSTPIAHSAHSIEHVQAESGYLFLHNS